MIAEKELRTGNLYITIRSHEIVVTGIDTVNKFVVLDSSSADLDISKKDSTIIFEDLNPIEITQARIAQLGFSEDNSMCLNIISDNRTKFTWDEKLQQIVLKDCNEGIIGQEIKYVHQLQNMYYFLTGKELPLF